MRKKCLRGIRRTGAISLAMKQMKGTWYRAAQVGERLYGLRRRAATTAAALLALMIGYHVVFGHNGLTVYGQKRKEAAELDKQLKALQKENDQMSGHIDRLKSDPSAIEHQAREELHYTRPGEVIYTLPPEKPDAKKSAK